MFLEDIIVYALPTTANAGADINLNSCDQYALLSGNTPVDGSGTWTCISSCTDLVIASPNEEITPVTGIIPSTTPVFRWTISNGECASSTDEVNVIIPSCDLYWIGGSGEWTNSNAWSVTSGGTSCNCIPTIHTGANIDNNSGIVTITMPVGTYYTKGFNMTGLGAKSSIVGKGTLLPRP